MRLRYADEAREDIKAAAQQWKTYRRPASTYFVTDMAGVRALLPELPSMGVAVQAAGGRWVRRLVLRRTGYLLFYDVNEGEGCIDVLRLWDPRRGPVEGL
jgi:plasmid stabilization system protein ParE